MKLVFKYLSPYKATAIFGLIIKILGTLCDLVIPYILSYIIDEVVLEGSVSKIVIWGLIMIVVALCGFLGNVFANQKASYTAKMTSKGIRRDLFDKMLLLSEKYKDEITLPSLVGRMTTDTYNTHQMAGMMQRLGVRAPILLIGGLIVCALVDPILTLIMASILPIIIIVIIIVAKLGMPLFNDLQKSNDTLVQNVRENVSGARVIKALGKEEYEVKRFEGINDDVCNKNKKANIRMSPLNPIITVLLNVGLAFVIIIGAYRCNQNLCTKGVVVSFTSYFAIISTAMLNLTRLFIIYSKASASAKRIEEVLNIDTNIEVINNLEESDSFIEFKDVTFSYLKQHNNIENISFDIKEGETLGIIGQTGSGKTTILNLLMRFYETDSGNIYFNHKNIKSYELEDLRKDFGVVFQNDLLFNETIYENISFGRNLSVETCIEALKDSCAYEFVSKLEKGIMTILDSKGNNLSGGQKQRLLIARALAGNPKVVLLDDSSSALDYKTDSILRKTLYSKYKSLVIVAQRISSIKDCTKILVLERGKITGYGTHDTLIKECQTYKEIAHSQMGVGDM